MDFKSLNLDPRLLKAIEDAGFTVPSPIQLQAIPEAMKGHDLRASAQTGTGKTIAYLLPALHRVLSEPLPAKGTGPLILVLVPTRELAMQVAKEAEKLTKHCAKCKTVCIYGGSPYPPQRKDLSRPYEVLVATPGRLIDHMEQGKISFSRLQTLILDEADRMLDMGFIEPVEQISAATPPSRQTLLFSATLKGEVLRLSQKLMNNPQEICVIPVDEAREQIKQQIYYVDHLSHKLELLKHLLTDDQVHQALIFTSTKQYAEELAQELTDIGHPASALHGDMNQHKRSKTLQRFHQKRLKILVATDVAARGIDVPNISHVFNFDLPRCGEDYTHRVGRTGRAGASGTAISFVCKKEFSLIKQIETFIKQELPHSVVDGLEPSFDVQSLRTLSRKSFGDRNDFGRRGPPRNRFGSSSSSYGSSDYRRRSDDSSSTYRNKGDNSFAKKSYYPSSEPKATSYGSPDDYKNRGYLSPVDYKKKRFETGDKKPSFRSAQKAR